MIMRIFGRDILTDPAIIEHIQALVGLREVKPFECVGTREESQAALVLTVQRLRDEGLDVPKELSEMIERLDEMGVRIDPRATLRQWNSEHQLPAAYENILRKAAADASLI